MIPGASFLSCQPSLQPLSVVVGDTDVREVVIRLDAFNYVSKIMKLSWLQRVRRRLYCEQRNVSEYLESGKRFARA